MNATTSTARKTMKLQQLLDLHSQLVTIYGMEPLIDADLAKIGLTAERVKVRAGTHQEQGVRFRLPPAGQTTSFREVYLDAEQLPALHRGLNELAKTVNTRSSGHDCELRYRASDALQFLASRHAGTWTIEVRVGDDRPELGRAPVVAQLAVYSVFTIVGWVEQQMGALGIQFVDADD